MSQDLDQGLRAIAERLGGDPLGLAVSGGGDSMALLELAGRAGIPARVMTVDHGLRDVRAELDLIAAAAERHGMPHHVLRWNWDGTGNLQDAARMARRQLLAQQARAEGVPAIALAHTADDQAETVLMRLSRGSGVDGLAGMADETRAEGVLWLRPLLGAARQDLRDYLGACGVAWAEDPSNNDPRFDRVRARHLQETLSTLGLSRDRLVRLADHMGAAARSLDARAANWASRHLREDRGDLLIAARVLELAAEDTPRRVLSAGFSWIGGSSYRPRYDSLRRAAAALRDGTPVTLAGCVVRPEGDDIRLTREAAAVASLCVPARDGARWDGRWSLQAPAAPAQSPPTDPSAESDQEIRALGEAGLAQCPDWRTSGLPRVSLLASPAIWQQDRLIAAPLAGLGGKNGDWQAKIITDFGSFLLSR